MPILAINEFVVPTQFPFIRLLTSFEGLNWSVPTMYSLLSISEMTKSYMTTKFLR